MCDIEQEGVNGELEKKERKVLKDIYKLEKRKDDTWRKSKNDVL